MSEQTYSERPIIFTGDSVRAIENDLKTQTRRVIPDDWWRCLDPEDAGDRASALPQCPYGVAGDRLWVRETWRVPGDVGNDRASTSRCTGPKDVQFKADGIEAPEWRPSMYMPRWASRLTLEIVSVRVERLQEIDRHDAIREGVDPRDTPNPVARFCKSWDSINAKRGYPWSSNPWVWVITFKRLGGGDAE